MYSESELHIAKICVKNKFLTEEQLEECLQASRLEPPGSLNSLGQIMISKNYVTLPQLQQAHRAQTYEQSRRYDKLFAEICFEKQLVSLETIDECLEEQKEIYLRGELKIPRLQDILLERNLISRSQMMEVMTEFLKRKSEASIKVGLKSEIENESDIEEADLLFAKLAAKNRLITEGQLNEIFKLYRLARETGYPKSVQALLEEKLYIQPPQSQTILKTLNYTNWRKQDKVYAEIAVSLELATERQVQEILELQKSSYMQNKPQVVRVLEELVSRGLITDEESEKIIKHERRNGIRQELQSIRTTGTFPAIARKKKEDSSSSTMLNIVKNPTPNPTEETTIAKPKTTRLNPTVSKLGTTSSRLKTVSAGSSKSKEDDEDKFPCPFCKKKIRPGSKKCKHCGYYLV